MKGKGIYFKIFNEKGENSTDIIRVPDDLSALNYEQPEIKRFSDDRYIISWTASGPDGSSRGVYFNLFNPTGYKMTTDIQINGYTDGSQKGSHIGIFSNDSFVVIWTSEGQDTSGNGVYFKLFNQNAQNTTDDIRANSYVLGDQPSGDIGTFSNDNFVISWSSNSIYSNSNIFFKLFDSSGRNLTDDTLANTDPAGNQYSSQFIIFSDNHFALVWSDWNRVAFRLFSPNGQNISHTITATNPGLVSPVSKILTNDRFMIIWQGDSVSDNGNYFTKFFDRNGQNISQDILLNLQSNTTDNYYPDFSPFLDGYNFVVAWRNHDSERIEVRIFNQSLCTALPNVGSTASPSSSPVQLTTTPWPTLMPSDFPSRSSSTTATTRVVMNSTASSPSHSDHPPPKFNNTSKILVITMGALCFLGVITGSIGYLLKKNRKTNQRNIEKKANNYLEKNNEMEKVNDVHHSQPKTSQSLFNNTILSLDAKQNETQGGEENLPNDNQTEGGKEA